MRKIKTSFTNDDYKFVFQMEGHLLDQKQQAMYVREGNNGINTLGFGLDFLIPLKPVVDPFLHHDFQKNKSWLEKAHIAA